MIDFVIFSLGQRTGSGWLSRILHSTGEAIVWGEPGLLRFTHSYLCSVQLSEAEPAVNRQDLHAFRADPSGMFPSSLAPDRRDTEAAFAGFITSLLEDAARKEGRRLCGFKETDFSSWHLQFVRRHWPATRILFLWRPFLEALESACGRGWLWGNHTVEWCERFLRVADATVEFFEGGGINAGLLRYSDLAANDRQICTHLGCSRPPVFRLPVIDHAERRPLGNLVDLLDPYLSRIHRLENRLAKWSDARRINCF